MSTAAVSSSSLPAGVQSFLQRRNADLKELGQALQSGDLAGAQQAFNAIKSLSQNNPSANGNSFKVSQRQQDFNALGQALEAGDLAGAQQAFADLKSTAHPHQRATDPPAADAASPSGSASQGTGVSVIA